MKLSLTALNREDVLLIKRMLLYIKPYKLKYGLAVLCIVADILFELIQPLIWGKIITGLFDKNISSIKTLLAIQFFVSLAGLLLEHLYTYLLTTLNESIIVDIKKNIFNKIISLPMMAFDKMRSGDFVSRLEGDTSNLSEIITVRLISLLVDMSKFLILGIVMLRISLMMTAIIIVSIPVVYLVFVSFSKILKKINTEILNNNDNYFSHINETFAMIREIRSLGLEKIRSDKFNNLIDIIKLKRIKIAVVSSLSGKISSFVNVVTNILVIITGSYLLYNGTLKMEYFIAFFSYSGQFTESIFNITELNMRIQQTLASLRRVFDLVDDVAFENNEGGSEEIVEINGLIEFEKVDFSYNEESKILKDISFSAGANSRTAIIGRSGAGKSTILSLIQRFYRPCSGVIRLDGTDIQSLALENLRSHISVVNQEPFFFNDTISNNLLYANPSSRKEDIEEACKKAHIHDYIVTLVDGYDTRIEESSTNLSVGQKQRLAIARALLRNSKIILFDEVTSALDNESQHNIKTALDELSADHTVIVIAHRLASVMDADRIIVVDEGAISAIGKHDCLFEENETYRNLFSKELEVAAGFKNHII